MGMGTYMVPAVGGASCGEMNIPKDLFNNTLNLIALNIPTNKCQYFIEKLSSHILRRHRLKSVLPDPKNSSRKFLFLNELVTNVSLSTLPESLRLMIIESSDITVLPREVKIGYEHFSASQVLRRLLPQNIEVPSTFQTVGHILHLNLAQEHLPHKYIIADVFLDKLQPQISTIVNKTGQIENEYRVFDMEILAGDKKIETELKENGCCFQLNLARVYWNSRLGTEHSRLVRLFKPTDVICDLFCGVGPFVVPAAKRGCRVFANDLNPDSYHFLTNNIKKNGVSKEVTTFNEDARTCFKHLRTKQLNNTIPEFNHIIMNLPNTALSFLDIFQEVYTDKEKYILPFIHCYCFSKNKEDPINDTLTKIKEILGLCNNDNNDDAINIHDDVLNYNLHHVRDVAPGKIMICASFKLPYSYACGNEKINKTITKKIKLK